MDIKFKTVLAKPLIQGYVPQYRAVVINNGVVDINALTKAIAEDCGLKPAVVKSVLELFFEQLGVEFRNGMRVNLEQLEGGLAIQGAAQSANEPWSAGNLKLVAYLNAKGELKNPFGDGVTPVNVTDAVSVVIDRVLDIVYETDGWITGTSDVHVLVGGNGLEVDPEKEDEGCWLADCETQEIVKVGTVTASTAATLDVTFDTLPEDGPYWLVVASRNGSGSHGVSIGRRKVTVKADPEAEEEG